MAAIGLCYWFIYPVLIFFQEPREPTLVTLNRFTAKLFTNPDEEDPNCIFLQAFTELNSLPIDKLRATWQVRFVHEDSIDSGGIVISKHWITEYLTNLGLFRECLSLMCDDLQSSRLPLFIKCPNAQSAEKSVAIGFNRAKWIPNPSCTDFKSLELYKFVGKVIGVCFSKKHYQFAW